MKLYHTLQAQHVQGPDSPAVGHRPAQHGRRWALTAAVAGAAACSHSGPDRPRAGQRPRRV